MHLSESEKKSLLPAILISIVAYLLLLGWLIVNILRKTGGHFIYALDDPYIHLALAENLAHGHYGINATEYSSPSSSLLWPFMLVPFSGSGFHVYLPLLWNVLFGVIAAGLIGYAVVRWTPYRAGKSSSNWLDRAVLTVLLLFCANLATLTIIGMEHVLQVMLAICCAIGVAEALGGREIPRWCVAAALLAPSVRYDALSLTLAVCFAMVALGSWKKAFAVFGISVLPLLGFSAFLKSKGLPLLPLSVLVKGEAFSDSGPVQKVLHLLTTNLHDALTDTERMPVVCFLLIFGGLAWHAESRLKRIIYAGAATLALLQLTIGRFGWLSRYEIFALIFLAMLCLRVLSERPAFIPGYLALASGVLFYVGATVEASGVALDVFDQQYQMHRFVNGFYQGNYAVNDLGLVSYHRRPNTYVLDLFGLASEDASKHWDKSASWMQAVTSRHEAHLAILYPQWFHIPASWMPIGRMCSPRPSLGGRCVVFYSTAEAYNAEIRSDLKAFVPTLPGQVAFYFNEPGQGDVWVPATQVRDTSDDVHERQQAAQ